MATKPPSPERVDPVTFLDCTLKVTWRNVCNTFDIMAETPPLQSLFHEADLSMPQQAAEQVLVNMLMGAIEKIGRFSPWYTQPACKFGLYAIHDQKTNNHRWLLTSEALAYWQNSLKNLQLAIEKNSGLIQASLLIDQVTLKELSNGQQTTAQCQCCPPKLICVKIEILEEAAITCDACHSTFVPV